jgi:integrase
MPTDAQVVVLLEAARDSDLEDLLVLIVGTGARIGEALAMQCSDVNLDLGLGCVRRTITRDRSGRAILGPRTKNVPSREVVLGPEVVAALRRQKAAVASLQIAAER